MPQSNLQAYREYFYATGNAAEVASLFFKGMKRSFVQDIETILNEYGLAAHLEQAKAQGRKLRILHLECGEGLYLHNLAEILEQRGWLETVEIFGVANNKEVISTAEEFSKISNPPRPYLQFYWHDLQMPLVEAAGLRNSPTQAHFDFILGLVVATHTANVQQIYRQIFTDNLNPAGIVLFSGFMTKEASNPTVDPHPALTPATRATLQAFGKNNPGLEVTAELGGWLGQWGASQVKTVQHRLEIGGVSEEGKAMLRLSVLNILKFGQHFIKAGLLGQADYDELIRVIYNELTPQMSGHTGTVSVIAAKPA